MSKEKSNNNDMVTIDPVKDLPELISLSYDLKSPMAISGPPGCGKSQIVEQCSASIAKHKEKKFISNPKFEDWLVEDNFCFVSLIGSQIQEIDALGIPQTRDIVGYGKITEFTPTALFPQEGIAAHGIIFLDELGNAQEPIKNALQNFLTKGGNISKNIHFIAATNSMEDNSGVGFTGMALRNRFQWFKVEYPELESWLDTMAKIGRPIDMRISAYLLSIGKKNYITYDPDKDQWAFSTPRSLERASNAIAPIERKNYKLLYKVVGGELGMSWAVDWIEFLQLSDKVDMEALLKNPAKIKQYESQIGTLYSICVALVDMSSKKEKIDPIIDLVSTMSRDDFGLLVFGGIIKKMGAMEFARNYLAKRKDFLDIKQRYLPLLATINI